MNDFALERGSPGGTPPIWGHRMLLRVFLQFARVAMDRSDGIKIAVAKEDDGIFRLAKASCGLDQRVENWLQIKRRATDDLEHIGGRRLLLQRFGKFPAAGLHLVEQADVFDGNHRLVGEGLEEFDLLLWEQSRLVAGRGNHPDGDTLAKHRHRQHAALA